MRNGECGVMIRDGGRSVGEGGLDKVSFYARPHPLRRRAYGGQAGPLPPGEGESFPDLWQFAALDIVYARARMLLSLGERAGVRGELTANIRDKHFGIPFLPRP